MTMTTPEQISPVGRIDPNGGRDDDGGMTTRNDERGLEQIADITREMREMRDAMNRKAKRRRDLVMRLRGNRITYRELAEAMGVSEVTVYKIIRGDQP